MLELHVSLYYLIMNHVTVPFRPRGGGDRLPSLLGVHRDPLEFILWFFWYYCVHGSDLR